MKTITLQIGNSDDKLTQREWCDFVTDMEKAVVAYRQEIHFSGSSYGAGPWQNFCWVFTIENDELVVAALFRQVHDIRKKYR